MNGGRSENVLPRHSGPPPPCKTKFRKFPREGSIKWQSKIPLENTAHRKVTATDVSSMAVIPVLSARNVVRNRSAEKAWPNHPLDYSRIIAELDRLLALRDP